MVRPRRHDRFCLFYYLHSQLSSYSFPLTQVILASLLLQWTKLLIQSLLSLFPGSSFPFAWLVHAHLTGLPEKRSPWLLRQVQSPVLHSDCMVLFSFIVLALFWLSNHGCDYVIPALLQQDYKLREGRQCTCFVYFIPSAKYSAWHNMC